MGQGKKMWLITLVVTLGIGSWALISLGHIPTVLGFTIQPGSSTVTSGPDLTAGALPHVQMTEQDPIEKATIYEVRVKNMTAGPVPAKSLVLVVDRVTDNRNGEEVGDRIDVLNADGHTQDGKSYYRVEANRGSWIGPEEKAKPIRVKMRERDKIPYFTPSFRVREVPAQG